jgi:hypothetical protein
MFSTTVWSIGYALEALVFKHSSSHPYMYVDALEEEISAI